MDEILSLDSLYANEDLPEELYQLVLHGCTSKLKSRLSELSNSSEYLTVLRWYGKEQLSLLMVAALHGHDEIVRFLLTCDSSDQQLKIRGKILNPDQTREDGVSALYCACYRGQFHVATTLIELGKADFNEDTADLPGCPLLLHATVNNRQDIVRFLLENRYVDLNETKSNDRQQFTALLLAAQGGHTSLVQYLINCGADVNYCSPDERLVARTALMCAIAENHLESFLLLYHAGAKTDDSILNLAVAVKSYSILQFLLDESLIAPDQLELEVCSSIHWPLSSPEGGMRPLAVFLKISLEYRQRTGLRKVCPAPLSIYDYQQECQTVDELESIADNDDRMFIEFLLIQERLHTPDHQSTLTRSLEEYTLMLVSKNRFDLCLELCHHLYDLVERHEGDPTLHCFIWLFCHMFSSDHHVRTDLFLQAADLIFRPSYQGHTQRSLNNALFMVVIATKILQQEDIKTDEQRAIYTWIQNLSRLNLRMSTGETLLHLCVDKRTAKNPNYRSSTTKPHLTFPHEASLRLLLTYGGRWLEINAMDSEGCTPLHTACREGASQSMIELLLRGGCHLDSVNDVGRTPISYVVAKSIIQLLTPSSKTDRLKCVCARLVARQCLRTHWTDVLPSELQKFVFLHGAPRT